MQVAANALPEMNRWVPRRCSHGHQFWVRLRPFGGIDLDDAPRPAD
jgi:hypothetical protein